MLPGARLSPVGTLTQKKIQKKSLLVVTEKFDKICDGRTDARQKKGKPQVSAMPERGDSKRIIQNSCWCQGSPIVAWLLLKTANTSTLHCNENAPVRTKGAITVPNIRILQSKSHFTCILSRYTCVLKINSIHIP